jgi:hypothetical protein
MAVKKCIHVVATEGYEPEMCAITLPNLKAYADKIGADFNVITKRKRFDWPIVCEKQQIYEIGRDYDWNISVDADMLIRPSMGDFTEWHPPTNVGNWWYFQASKVFDTLNNKYFIKDGRDYGIVECFVVTTKHTHDLWEPLPGSFDDYKHLFLDKLYWRAGEYCLSHNLAKYSLNVSGILKDTYDLYHINATSEKVTDSAQLAYNKLKEWGAI